MDKAALSVMLGYGDLAFIIDKYFRRPTVIVGRHIRRVATAFKSAKKTMFEYDKGYRNLGGCKQTSYAIIFYWNVRYREIPLVKPIGRAGVQAFLLR